MKKFIAISVLASSLFIACDKVDNAYPKDTVSDGLDWSLYPDGDSSDYVAQGYWPSFTTNTNTQRNVLIEDFTGHQCVNCPYATYLMEQYIASHSENVFPLAIHAGPTGLGGFQLTDEHYPTVLYCDSGLELGEHFGTNDPGSAFVGNPAFCVNRVVANDQFVSTPGSVMQNKANACLASQLKVNLQAATNYFPSTRGLFLHVEVDKLDQSLSSELAVVVCVVEDSLVGPQICPENMDTEDGEVNGRNDVYVHRDILRGMIDNRTFGKTLSSEHIVNGKYRLDYSYKLPNQFEAENMKLYIYVYDKTTQEIYHVIEKHFL